MVDVRHLISFNAAAAAESKTVFGIKFYVFMNDNGE